MAAKFDCIGRPIIKKEARKRRRSNRCSHSDWYNRSSDYKARMHGWR